MPVTVCSCGEPMQTVGLRIFCEHCDTGMRHLPGFCARCRRIGLKPKP